MARAKSILNAIGGVLRRDDRICERNPVTVMAGKEQARRFVLDFFHQGAKAAEPNIILRDGFREERVMFEGRLAFNAEEHAQIGAR